MCVDGWLWIVETELLGINWLCVLMVDYEL